MQEDYKIIEGFENYSVSNFGNVRNNKTLKLLKQFNTKGYRIVGLSNQSKQHSRRVHILVSNAFLPNPQNKPITDHIDNNRANNNVSNLRWASHSENSYNRCISNQNTTGFKGIVLGFNGETEVWRAQIHVNKELYFIGDFKTKLEAVRARVQKSIEVQGEFINKCELLALKQLELDQELEDLENEFELLIK